MKTLNRCARSVRSFFAIHLIGMVALAIAANTILSVPPVFAHGGHSDNICHDGAVHVDCPPDDTEIFLYILLGIIVVGALTNASESKSVSPRHEQPHKWGIAPVIDTDSNSVGVKLRFDF